MNHPGVSVWHRSAPRRRAGAPRLLVTVAALLLAGCASDEPHRSPSAALRKLSEDYLAVRFAAGPLEAVGLGLHAYDGRFGEVVIGHTPGPHVRRLPHIVMVDTGACYGGELSAYCPETREVVAVPGLRPETPRALPGLRTPLSSGGAIAGR